jgi:hypothetical protein
MPIHNNKLKVPDPFIMKKEDVNQCIVAFLETNGFDVSLMGQRDEIDIIAVRDNMKFYIESRGNQATMHTGDKLFDSSQLDIHLSEQVTTLMKNYSEMNNEKWLVIANPNIPRLKNRIARIEEALDKLGIIRIWVNDDKSLFVEGSATDLLENYQLLLNKVQE